MRKKRRPRQLDDAPPLPIQRTHNRLIQRGVVWQCHACGAPADPIYGRDENSWCPSCAGTGTICGEEGQFPFPQKYGAWVKAQRARHAAEADDEFTLQHLAASLSAQKKEKAVKQAKTHTGTYHCAECLIEFELYGEASLKCDTCQGPLAQGSLDDVLEGGPDKDDQG
jgi:rRNA maturation endonuclease Nob1